jgi:hypothetical protein
MRPFAHKPLQIETVRVYVNESLEQFPSGGAARSPPIAPDRPRRDTGGGGGRYANDKRPPQRGGFWGDAWAGPTP